MGSITTRPRTAIFLALVLLAAAPRAFAQADSVARGEYIVRHVSMCIVCHTPKDETGELVESQLLMGAPIPLESPYGNRDWARAAPKIAGLPGGYQKEDVVRLLMTGKTKAGHPPQRPMPPFRMNREDASAVAAYLASLEPAPAGAPVP